MARNSKIEWTHHTFNPWWGCAKVSPACKHCYAETWAKRVGNDVWGKGKTRRYFSDAHWNEPLKWEKEAIEKSFRPRVFCASMADVFERRSDLREHRIRLWDTILKTPSLDWLILTKRPQNVEQMVPWENSNWPENIWLGTTIENQNWAEKRLPILLKLNPRVRFLSCEPLLGPLNMSKWLGDKDTKSIDWIIAGGESGSKSRPMNPKWVRDLRDQSLENKIAFHFKQWGHWSPNSLLTRSQKKTITIDNVEMTAVGKKASGRELDGRTWDEVPNTA